jgi:hypothetical protein
VNPGRDSQGPDTRGPGPWIQPQNQPKLALPKEALASDGLTSYMTFTDQQLDTISHDFYRSTIGH